MRKESSTNLRNERWSLAQCPFSLTLAALGSRWGAAILWKILCGETRFGDRTRALPLISQKMLAEQFERLQALGIIEKRTSTTRPLRVEYAATERGRALEPVLAAMRAWREGQQSGVADEGDLPEIKLLDRGSGPLQAHAARTSHRGHLTEAGEAGCRPYQRWSPMWWVGSLRSPAHHAAHRQGVGRRDRDGAFNTTGPGISLRVVDD